MADGVTRLGKGWDRAPQGTAEHALGELIAAGQLTGEALTQALIARGNGSRGPAYYPPNDEGGPFYALGNPHTYAAIAPDRSAWELLGNLDNLPMTDSAPVPDPVVTWNVSPVTQAQLDAAVQAIRDEIGLNVRAVMSELEQIEASLEQRSDANTEKIQQQIDQAIRNAENSVRALAPIVEAALPALSGLFARK